MTSCMLSPTILAMKVKPIDFDDADEVIYRIDTCLKCLLFPFCHSRKNRFLILFCNSPMRRTRYPREARAYLQSAEARFDGRVSVLALVSSSAQ